MPRSRVFILYSHGLFARGVQSLLAREPEVEVVGMEKDDRSALDRLQALGPDVILVDSDTSREGSSREDTNREDTSREGSSPTISEIFERAPGARVISLSLHENGIDIYDRHRIVACGPAELVQAIRRDEEGERGSEGVRE